MAVQHRVASALRTARGAPRLAVVTAPPVPVALAALAVVAVVVSVGATVSTPASSQILARYAPPRYAPLVFSIKQAAVPVGVAISSFLVPALTLAYGWRAATLVIAGACVAVALALQPCRAAAGRRRLRPAGTWASMSESTSESFRPAQGDWAHTSLLRESFRPPRTLAAPS